MQNELTKPQISPEFYCSRCDKHLSKAIRSKKDKTCCTGCEKKKADAATSQKGNRKGDSRKASPEDLARKARINAKVFERELRAIDAHAWVNYYE